MSDTTDITGLDLAGAIARKQIVEQRLGQIKATGPAHPTERADLVAEKDRLEKVIAPLREAEKRVQSRRTFAGLQTPLFAAAQAMLTPDILAQLESAALELQAQAEQRAAERRAAKAAAMPPGPVQPATPATVSLPTPSPAPSSLPPTATRRGPMPEVIVIRRARA